MAKDLCPQELLGWLSWDTGEMVRDWSSEWMCLGDGETKGKKGIEGGTGVYFAKSVSVLGSGGFGESL